MAKYKKKPVVIEAIQWIGTNVDEILGFVVTKAELRRIDVIGPNGGTIPGGGLVISTLEGDMTASPDDWIIKGVKDEFYPCKPDIFAATYDKVEQPAAVLV